MFTKRIGIDLGTAPFFPLNSIDPAASNPKALAVAAFPFVSVIRGGVLQDIGPARGINLLSGFAASYAGGNAGLSGFMSMTAAVMAGFDPINTSGLTPVAVSNDGRMFVHTSGQAVGSFGNTYSLVSGVGVFNIISGRAVLHTIAVNQWVSGGLIEIRDSTSGLAGTIIGAMTPNITTVTAAGIAVLAPHFQLYDAAMANGIVVSTSGLVNATVMYRRE